ncbi:hypothetical protein [Sphingomicrobium astaxanthinifaciens]|uniref:hypothetical protein n=1 Tax=Sphingomicrobium astaxanthinifaciens TaxID=1227949 RepID=UPI001FCAEA52|nr:hypothetical protein [Sphingomicrobium astaxanthinifaciens]MCJ7421550.1 hypothetical protein [Sphingomicrobium astaxanthinifaciens]
MELDWDEIVAGVPTIQVRDFLKLTTQSVSRDYLIELRSSQYEVGSLLDELLARGWIEEDGRGVVRNTLAGNAVAQAKKLERISRNEAELLLQEVLEAVDEINGDDVYAYDVTHLAVFGSYLTETDTLSDLDIAYELRPRWTPKTAEEVSERSIRAFSPPKSADWMRRLGWPEEVVLEKGQQARFAREAQQRAFPWFSLREPQV